MGRPRGRLPRSHFQGQSNVSGFARGGQTLKDILDDLRISADSVEVDEGDAELLYVDTDAGDDDNDGSSWDRAKKTQAVFDLVPAFGWTYVYLRGSAQLDIDRPEEAMPISGFQGHLRILGADDWEEIASGTVTSYSASGGTRGSDAYDLDLGVYSKADATDRFLFLEVQDDAGVWHVRKVLEYDSGGVEYDVERPGALTVTGGNACKLVRPVSHVHLAAITRGPRVSDGSVWFVGCKVTSDALTFPSHFMGYAGCQIDTSTSSFGLTLGINSGIGSLRSSGDKLRNLNHVTMKCTALVGTYLEGKQGTGVGAYNFGSYLGCHHKSKDTSFGYSVIYASEPNWNGVMHSVTEGAGYLVGFTNVTYSGIINSRGIGANCRIEVGASSVAYFEACDWEGLLKIENCSTAWHYGGVKFARVDVIEGQVVGFGASDLELVGAAADEVGFMVHPNSGVKDTVVKGGFAVSSAATPLIQIEGDAEDLEIDTTAVDRGAGPLVLATRGARVKLGATATGDNSNGGGHGLEVRDGAIVEEPSGQALTGNSGVTTTVHLGALGLTAHPASGVRKNDLPADPAGTEELVLLSKR